MDVFEILVLVVCLIGTGVLGLRWYIYTGRAWPLGNAANKAVLSLLPLVAMMSIVYTLTTMADILVVDDAGYIWMYTLMGLFCMFALLNLVSLVLDLSWRDDVLANRNAAAAIAVFCAGMGLTLVFCGANIGDGPGWWCVIFAGGLGVGAWLLLCMLLAKTTDAFERITVNRDLGCTLRIGGYMLASGLLLGRASAGDWTSFGATVVEFGDGWPVLVLTGLVLVIERMYLARSHSALQAQGTGSASVVGSAVLATIYVIISIIAIMLLPKVFDMVLVDWLTTFSVA